MNSSVDRVLKEKTALLSSPRSSEVAILLIVMLSAAWKILLLILGQFPFNSDEAIVGLMARHILAGNIPTFFYGQAYMGSLDAILVALAMGVLGTHIWVIRLVQVILYIAIVYLVFLLTKNVLGSHGGGLVAALVVAIPAVNVTLYTTVSLGGYNEAMLIGIAFFLLLYEIEEKGVSSRRMLAMGGLAGLGLWAFGLTLVFTIPGLIGLLIVLRRRRTSTPWLSSFLLLVVGGLVGSLPWLLWAMSNGPTVVIGELLGSAIAGATSGGILQVWLLHVRNLLLFGPTVILGLRPPWSTEPLLLPLIPVVLVFWSGVAVLSWKRISKQQLSITEVALIGSAGLLLLGFILTPFGADPSGRYFLPLLLPMAVLAGGAFRWLKARAKGNIAWIMVIVLLAYHASSTLQAAYRHEEGLTTQFDPVARLNFSNIERLIAFLESEEIDRGYTNYWVAYPLAFRSGEELIFVPALPYHRNFRFTPRDNRYPPYNDLVSSSDEVAYITTNHPELDDAITGSLLEKGVNYKVETIEPFTVYYDLSERILPSHLDLPTGKGIEG